MKTGRSPALLQVCEADTQTKGYLQGACGAVLLGGPLTPASPHIPDLLL